MRFKKKESLHNEIKKNLDETVTKLLQSYPTADSVPELPIALEKFNVWKAKVTAEVVESIKKIDILSRQLHDALVVGYKLMAEQGNEGKQIIAKLVHATVEDKQIQLSTAEKVEKCRAYKQHLRILLERAEEQEEKLLKIELEERRKQNEQMRLEEELDDKDAGLFRVEFPEDALPNINISLPILDPESPFATHE